MGRRLALAILACGPVFATEPPERVSRSGERQVQLAAVTNRPAVSLASKKAFTPLMPPYRPRERASRPRTDTLQIAGIAPSASNTLVRLEGPPGKRYDVQSTPDLVGVVWRWIGSATLGAGGLVEFTDPCATNVQYYRLATPKAKADFMAALSLLLLGP